ncbi:PREDICTED: uncharacterized protein LOC108777761 [Cyphomyrmex costatus]|uniref:uncharacterized protein LOC108777761 n=1 Tax=Cyphomyrmex costatus TaxID=456900 RepID=UPI0008523DE1|nr:PREDICTED: uncharacterized protein LOC108777761 [Cyphomyrmex costatus]
MADASKLVKTRGKIKGQLTRVRNWLRVFDVQTHQIEEVEIRLTMLQRAWDEFHVTQDALEEVNAEFENDGERESFESDYYATAGAARALIAERERTRVRRENRNLNDQGTGNAANAVDKIKLPPINVPTFNGTYDQWPNFRDTFKAVIDENEALSDIKKLYYLRLALKGVAAEVLESMEMSADNYDVAWDLLKNRFENKRVLVHHHVQALIEFPVMQKESQSNLRQLLDHTEKHVRALKKLGEPTDSWGTILVHLMTAKFDNVTKREWETKTSSREVATYTQFIEFTTNRCIMLEALQIDKLKSTKVSSVIGDKSANANKKTVAAPVAEVSNKCSICKEGKHRIYHCPTFLNWTPQARSKEIKGLKLCFNCFKKGHSIEACNFTTCRMCHKKHNTLLHVSSGEDTKEKSQTESSSINPMVSTEQSSTSVTHYAARQCDRGLLATAIVEVQDNEGNFQECRAFLDPGSQSNFMTKELCERLCLHQQKNYMQIRGIDGTTALTETYATIRSRINAFKVKLGFSVLPKITMNLSLTEINKRHLQIPSSITLADPSFHTPGQVDLLLGSTIFWELLCVGQIKLEKNQPVAQKTKFGWIIAGPITFESNNMSIVSASMSFYSEKIEDQLERFWKVEESAICPGRTENNEECENEFVQTHRRNKDGRFEIRLPLSDSIERLGHSRDIAIKRLKSMERKFARSSDLRHRYNEFMQEYERVGHMTEIKSNDNSESSLYLPHHAVLREDKSTTKLRVVFDASCPTSTGVALNDILRAGPTIQQELTSILLRFRQHRFVITADIKQMYRQILIQEDQRDLQRIVWRQDSNEPIRDFRLNTVTYGVTSAPFLAVRCLHQLAIKYQDQYPDTSNVILNDFYVDDLLSGGDDVHTLQRIKHELTEILHSAGFQLHKWNTNESREREASSEVKSLPIGDEIKTLGVCWNITDDCFQFTKLKPSKIINV